MKLLKNILLITIPVVLFAALFTWSYVSKKVPENPAGTVGNTAGNLNNGGLFCEDDGKVYFANAYDNYALYVMNPDETDVKKLSNAQVSSLNAAGNFLYYYQSSSSASDHFSSMFRTNGVYRSKKNGKSSVCLKRVPSPSLSLWDNTIFYQSYSTKTGTSLCRIDIDKDNYEEIQNYVINPASIQDHKIYFGGTGKDHYLYTMDTDTNSIAAIFMGDVYNPIVQGEYVYYMDISSDYRLCRYSLYSQTVEILTEDRLDFFNVTGDYIYYQKSDAKEPALKRIYTDGTGEEVVAPGVYENINATSQYVYFNAYDTPSPVFHTPLYGPVQVETFSAAATAVAQSDSATKQ